MGENTYITNGDKIETLFSRSRLLNFPEAFYGITKICFEDMSKLYIHYATINIGSKIIG